MRMSCGGASALSAVFLITLGFWLDTGHIGGSARALAQEKPKAERRKVDAGAPPKGVTHPGQQPKNNQGQPHPPFVLEPAPTGHPLSSDLVRRSKVEARIVEALNQPIDFVIEPEPLKDALDFIAARYQIPILVNRTALEDVNVALKTEVHMDAQGILLHDALELIFADLSQPLGYDVAHGVLMISTADKINQQMQTIVYDCRDLVNMAMPDCPVPPDGRQSGKAGQAMMQFGVGGGSWPGPGFDKRDRPEKTSDRFWANRPFIQMVTSATGSENWGDGTSISELRGLLIVRQNRGMHERIKALLESIRVMKKEGAFAAMGDQYDAKAKVTEQSSLKARLAKLEQEVTQLRAANNSSARQVTTPATK
jgi:hypothetical protein